MRYLVNDRPGFDPRPRPVAVPVWSNRLTAAGLVWLVGAVFLVAVYAA